MKFSLRMLILLVAGISAGLALLVNASSTAAVLSDLAVVVLLLAGITLIIACSQPARSFWLATTVAMVVVQLFLHSNFPFFREMRLSINEVLIRPVYTLLNSPQAVLESATAYRQGNRIFYRVKSADGNWVSNGDRSVSSALAAGVDVAGLPKLASFSDFYRIAINLLAIGIGLICGWVALAVRQKQTPATVGDS